MHSQNYKLTPARSVGNFPPPRTFEKFFNESFQCYNNNTFRNVMGIGFLNMFKSKLVILREIYQFWVLSQKSCSCCYTNIIAAKSRWIEFGPRPIHPNRGVSGGPGLFGRVQAPIGASSLAWEWGQRYLTIRIGSNRNKSWQIAASIIGRKFKLRPIVETIIGRKSHHRNGPMIATPDYKCIYLLHTND
jgi:hypothetical protein